MLRTFRLAAVQLALAAMVLRALLPMGWMPNPEGYGQDHGQQQNNEQCPFAAAPHAAAPVTVAEVAPPSVLSRFVVHEAAPQAVHGAGHHQPQSPRAPPEIV